MAYSQAVEVLFRVVPGYLALSKVDGENVEVHGPAADVWLEIVQPIELDQIVEILANRYSADCATVHADVQRLLTSLVEGGYVEQNG